MSRYRILDVERGEYIVLYPFTNVEKHSYPYKSSVKTWVASLNKRTRYDKYEVIEVPDDSI